MPSADFQRLLDALRELEELVHLPSAPGHIERVNLLAISIARRAPARGNIPHLAMMVSSAANQLKKSAGNGGGFAQVDAAIKELRAALEAASDSSS